MPNEPLINSEIPATQGSVVKIDYCKRLILRDKKNRTFFLSCSENSRTNCSEPH